MLGNKVTGTKYYNVLLLVLVTLLATLMILAGTSVSPFNDNTVDTSTTSRSLQQSASTTTGVAVGAGSGLRSRKDSNQRKDIDSKLNIVWNKVVAEARALKTSSPSSSSSSSLYTINLPHIEAYHNKGPTNGTDIKVHPLSLLKCHNQTRCIQPQLQLNKVFNVYFCKHIAYGVRFYFLSREGLLLHPMVKLVNSPEEAEVLIYLPVSSKWEESECNKENYREKTVVLDEGDYPSLFTQPGKPWLMYFKRSYINRDNGQFRGYMDYLADPAIMPMTYTIADAYVKPDFNMIEDRKLEIVCTLRPDPTRQRVAEWVGQYAKARGVKNFIAGEVNHASRTTIDSSYFSQMHDAQIIVTANPNGWEGDFRLMEAMASGALVFVDRMYVPRPNPLVTNRHIVVYDNNNKTDLFEKLDYYRGNKDIAKKVAVSGYLHSMKHHRAANLIDYILRTVHVKLDHTQKSKYVHTGYDMRHQALEINKAYQEKVKKAK